MARSSCTRWRSISRWLSCPQHPTLFSRCCASRLSCDRGSRQEFDRLRLKARVEMQNKRVKCNAVPCLSSANRSTTERTFVKPAKLAYLGYLSTDLLPIHQIMAVVDRAHH